METQGGPGDEPTTILDGMAGSGTESDPYVVTDVRELQAIRGDRSAWYALGDDVDASGCRGWNHGAGFEPIGRIGTPFTGVFDGRGHEISGLSIVREPEPEALPFEPTDPETIGADDVGLFGVNGGVVRRVDLVDATVEGSGRVGALVGHNLGTVAAASVTGTVIGDVQCGALVGVNRGVSDDDSKLLNIDPHREAYVETCATLGVPTVEDVGGSQPPGPATALEAPSAADPDAFEGGVVIDSRAAVDVEGVTAGGLVGHNTLNAVVRRSSADGRIAGRDTLGGLVGENCGDVLESTARGHVDGGESCGGLVGHNEGRVVECVAEVTVSGTVLLGGLVGANQTPEQVSTETLVAMGLGFDLSTPLRTEDLESNHGALVASSVARGAVTATGPVVAGAPRATDEGSVGGLVGWNSLSTIANAAASGDVTATGDGVGGLVGLNGEGVVLEASASGAVDAEGDGVGGLIGKTNRGHVGDSVASGDVDAVGDRVGGLVGQVAGHPDVNAARPELNHVTGSVARGDVTVTGDCVGGLVGRVERGYLEACLADGDVVVEGSRVGGLVGHAERGAVESAVSRGTIEATGDYVDEAIGWNVNCEYEPAGDSAVDRLVDALEPGPASETLPSTDDLGPDPTTPSAGDVASNSTADSRPEATDDGSTADRESDEGVRSRIVALAVRLLARFRAGVRRVVRAVRSRR